jgi:hypothetical protein
MTVNLAYKPFRILNASVALALVKDGSTSGSR